VEELTKRISDSQELEEQSNRYIEDLLIAFKKLKEENARLSTEMEEVEAEQEIVVGENMTLREKVGELQNELNQTKQQLLENMEKMIVKNEEHKEKVKEMESKIGVNEREEEERIALLRELVATNKQIQEENDQLREALEEQIDKYEALEGHAIDGAANKVIFPFFLSKLFLMNS